MAVRDRIHVHAVGWALALLVGAALVLLGTLNYPIIEGKPVASGRGLNGDKLLEIFLNKQCIDSSCEQVTSESSFLQAAYILIIVGSVGALMLCLIVFWMAFVFPHSQDLGFRLAGSEFKLTLILMIMTSIVCFAGWLMIPLSFPELASECNNNVTTTTQIHCSIPCDNGGHMDPFILCGPYRPGAGAYIIFVGMAFVYISPVFARWWVRRYEQEYDTSDAK